MTSAVYTLPDFQEAQVGTPGQRVHAVRAAAVRFRERFMASGMPDAVATCDLISLPYVTRYAFWHAIKHPSPYLMFTNRMIVVKYKDWDNQPRVLLFNPTDHRRAAEVPYYKRMAAKYGEFLSYRVLSKVHGTVEGHLERLGLKPEDIDFISFDHLHTQDLRGWIGETPYFPNAKILVQRSEWQIFDQLHPLQNWWYQAHATDGVPAERVAILDGDVSLGPGVALLATPGHTWGNHSLALHTPRGVTVISENGVSLDNYNPEHSRLPGLKAYAATGQEVVLNGNTLEGALEQYVSMIKEKVVAGPHPDDPRFCNHFSSSELTAHWLFPGLAPTLAQRSLSHGRF
ncbi:MAG: hypothetical protein JWM80_5177 [Cyanobacteria bacterium RYN_339]|nr:hypothetical protein [Cyanobacteria bacterium RYN_339]